AIWLGITHVRGVVALLNTNLGGEALAHSIRIVNPRHIIVDSSLLAPARLALAKSSTDIQLWVFGPGAPPGLPRIDLERARYPTNRVERAERQPPTIADAALYIYSSGTTGLPKAARINHFRILEWSYWFAGMMGARAEDRMYDCLPMYHSTGGVVAPGSMLVSGGSVVIRPSFSAR